MIELWLAIAALTVLGLLFVLVPLVRYQNHGTKVNASSAWFINRKQELEQEFKSGFYTEDEYQQALTELKLTAKDELVSAKEEVEGTKASLADKKLVFVAAAILVAVSVSFYVSLGQYEKLEKWQESLAKMPELSKKVIEQGDQQVTVEELNDFALGLRTKLAQKQDPIGWMLLGRVSMSLNDIDAAVLAFEKSNKMNPDNASNNLSYAQALQLKGEDWQIQKSLRLLQQVMSVQPQNELAIILFGEGNMMLENFDLAKRSFEFAKQVLPAEDPRHSAIDSRIEFLSQQLGLTMEPSTPGLSIEVQVTDAVRANLKQFKYLFVFAKTGQMPMPIAVKKLPVSEFPVTLRLTDSDIMLPEQKLSDFASVNLTARLSMDEQANLEAGDRQAVIENVSTQESQVINIVISEEQ